MINRLLRWAMWSPAHLAVTVAGAVVLLVALALVFRPTGGADAGPQPRRDAPEVVDLTQDAAPDPFEDPTGDGAAATTVPPADHVTLSVPAVNRAVASLYRDFTSGWLTGLGATSRPAWVADVCDGRCTPYLEQMLGTTTTSQIPDASVAGVVVDSVTDSESSGRVRLSDGAWLRLRAEWDGDHWVIAEIEPA